MQIGRANKKFARVVQHPEQLPLHAEDSQSEDAERNAREHREKATALAPGHEHHSEVTEQRRGGECVHHELSVSGT
jgi:hypothetical protein